MSLTSAMSSALSGLNVGARLAEVASNNIANALTEGFSKRTAEIANRTVGGIGTGVRVVSIERQINAAVAQDLRLSKAANASLDAQLDVLKSIETAFGSPTDGTSLTGRLATLERSLVEAAAKPDSEVLLLRARDSANALALRLNEVSGRLRAGRQSADASIAKDVETLNATLREVRGLNIQISAMSARGQDISESADQRQRLIDRISTLVPLRDVAQDGNQIALFTTTGLTLLDGRATVFSFEPKAAIDPSDSLGSGTLSGLMADGKPVLITPEGGRLGEGRLSALFAVRDETTVKLQSSLDTIAHGLIERLAGPSVDPTLAAGEPGLFVDGTDPNLPLATPGLASRIAVNPALSDGNGTGVWKLRDGIHATLDPNRADATILQAISRQLSGAFPIPGNPSATPSNMATLTGETLSLVASQRVTTEANASFTRAKSEVLKTELLKGAVDSDREIQDLMQIEKAYAANAKVIQTIDDMLRNLLEI